MAKMNNIDSEDSDQENDHDKIQIQPFDADFFANDKPMISDFQDNNKPSNRLFSSNTPSFGG